MIIKDLNNTFFFTTSAFFICYTAHDLNQGTIKICSNNERENNAIIHIGELNKDEVMNHIYKSYKRDDRCCDLNDLLKKDNEK